MTAAQHWGRTAIAVFAAALVFFSLGLSWFPLWSNDEVQYAQIVREMLRTGDWITMHYQSKEWICHPPLYFWLAALCTGLTSSSELAIRLPSTFFGAGLVALTFIFGTLLVSRRVGLIAAACFGLCLQTFLMSRMAILDTEFLFFITAALLGFWYGYQNKSRNGYYFMFLGMGLACLSKGPFGLIFPWIVIVPFLAGRRELGCLKDMPWLLGAPLAAFVGLSWFAIELARHGDLFVRTVFGEYFVGRVLARVQTQGGPWWEYFPVVFLGFLPWSFFLPQGLVALWRRFRADKEDAAAWFTFCWTLVPFIALTAAATKLPSYGLMVFPAAAVTVAWLLDGLLERRAWRSLAVPTALAGLLALAISAALHLYGAPKFTKYAAGMEALALTFAPVALGAVMGLAAAVKQSSPQWIPRGLMAGMVGMLLCCVLVLSPTIEQYRPMHRLAMQARALAAPDVKVGIHGRGKYELVYYTDLPLWHLQEEEDAWHMLQFPSKVLIVMSTKMAAAAPPGMPLYVIARSADSVLVANWAATEGASPGTILSGEEGKLLPKWLSPRAER